VISTKVGVGDRNAMPSTGKHHESAKHIVACPAGHNRPSVLATVRHWKTRHSGLLYESGDLRYQQCAAHSTMYAEGQWLKRFIVHPLHDVQWCNPEANLKQTLMGSLGVTSHWENRDLSQNPVRGPPSESLRSVTTSCPEGSDRIFYLCLQRVMR